METFGAGESLPGLIDQQAAIGKELRGLIDTRFESSRVFSRMLRKSLQAIEDAVKRLEERKSSVLDQFEGIAEFNAELENLADKEESVPSKELALLRLDLGIIGGVEARSGNVSSRDRIRLAASRT